LIMQSSKASFDTEGAPARRLLAVTDAGLDLWRLRVPRAETGGTNFP